MLLDQDGSIITYFTLIHQHPGILAYYMMLINDLTLHFFNSYSPPAPLQKLSSPGHFILSRPQCLQNTHKGLHSASKQPQKRVKGENRLRCSVQRREVKRGTNSISMILYFHIFPQAQLKKEFITQLTAVRDKPLSPPLACVHACTHRQSIF